MKFTIRDATLEDMEQIASIYEHHVLNGTASFEEEAPSVFAMRQRREAVIARGLPYLVAEQSDRILGYSYAGLYRARSAYRFSLENSVYVDHALARQGIGRALLDALIARCELGPWRQMIAVIGDSAHVASIALHEQAGFRMIGTLHSVGFKFGRWLDSVLMQRPLGPGDETPARAMLL